MPCPKCGTDSKRYDSRIRQWRHLDTCQFQTIIEADVPRVTCKEHGCVTIPVPWAEDSSRYTLLFENQVLNWAAETSILALTRQLKLSWNAIDGIIKRAVDRGLKRRRKFSCKHLFVDETCVGKPRVFITVLSNQLGQILAIKDGRSSESLLQCFSTIPVHDINKMKSISMDLSAAYKKAVFIRFGRRAKKLIAYDHFHITKMLNEALFHVQRSEVRSMPNLNKLEHHKSRFLWFKNRQNRTEEIEDTLDGQKQYLIKTAVVWYFKEQFRIIWKTVSYIQAKSAWKTWIKLAKEAGIKALTSVVGTIENCLEGIINAMHYGVSNGRAEALNNNIKALGRQSRGYRNIERYKSSIFFHFGGLDMVFH
ncbi:ISL3 family transposase [Pseudomonas sp. HK3]